MSYSVDVLNSTLVDLLPRYEELFIRHHPLLAYILKGSKVEKSKLKSAYREFTVVTGGPGQGTGLPTGNETLSSSRRNVGLRGREYGYRYIYHFAVPGKDLAEASGEQDYARIIDNYPSLAVADAKEIFARQTMRGSASSGSDDAGTEASGFLTLNGDQTYNPQGLGARTGIFQYAAPASQTATVHDLPMQGAASSPTTGWYHQYGHIGSFSLEGLKTMRTLATRANQQGETLEGGGIDLLLGDEGSFQNYIEAMDDKVIEVDKINNPAAKFINRQGVKFGTADFYWEPEIDITDTTSFSSANPQDGVIYGLNCSKWELFNVGNNSDKATKGNWDMVTPTAPLPDQDAWQWRLIAYLNFCCHSLRNQFCMTGGANT
jgi:hypothetical protein